MFWIIAVAVVAVCFALAWWSSGRAAPKARNYDNAPDLALDKSQVEGLKNHLQGPFGSTR